jgi:hypothetical protein
MGVAWLVAVTVGLSLTAGLAVTVVGGAAVMSTSRSRWTPGPHRVLARSSGGVTVRYVPAGP